MSKLPVCGNCRAQGSMQMLPSNQQVCMACGEASQASLLIAAHAFTTPSGSAGSIGGSGFGTGKFSTGPSGAQAGSATATISYRISANTSAANSSAAAQKTSAAQNAVSRAWLAIANGIGAICGIPHGKKKPCSDQTLATCSKTLLSVAAKTMMDLPQTYDWFAQTFPSQSPTILPYIVANILNSGEQEIPPWIVQELAPPQKPSDVILETCKHAFMRVALAQKAAHSAATSKEAMMAILWRRYIHVGCVRSLLHAELWIRASLGQNINETAPLFLPELWSLWEQVLAAP